MRYTAQSRRCRASSAKDQQLGVPLRSYIPVDLLIPDGDHVVDNLLDGFRSQGSGLRRVCIPSPPLLSVMLTCSQMRSHTRHPFRSHSSQRFPVPTARHSYISRDCCHHPRQRESGREPLHITVRHRQRLQEEVWTRFRCAAAATPCEGREHAVACGASAHNDFLLDSVYIAPPRMYTSPPTFLKRTR